MIARRAPSRRLPMSSRRRFHNLGAGRLVRLDGLVWCLCATVAAGLFLQAPRPGMARGAPKPEDPGREGARATKRARRLKSSPEALRARNRSGVAPGTHRPRVFESRLEAFPDRSERGRRRCGPPSVAVDRCSRSCRCQDLEGRVFGRPPAVPTNESRHRGAGAPILLSGDQAPGPEQVQR